MVPKTLEITHTKVCKYCGAERPLEAFEVCRVVGEKVYRRLRCHRCKREQTNERRGALRRWLGGYKKTLQCARCGFSDYRALEFHHQDSREKDFNIGDMVRIGLAQATIQREINKCLVLCANCHRIEHYDERCGGHWFEACGFDGIG